VQRAVRLKEPAARWFFQQLVIGLDYCHRKGVVNRDIKLENTLLQMVQVRRRVCRSWELGVLFCVGEGIASSRGAENTLLQMVQVRRQHRRCVCVLLLLVVVGRNAYGDHLQGAKFWSPGAWCVGVGVGGDVGVWGLIHLLRSEVCSAALANHPVLDRADAAVCRHGSPRHSQCLVFINSL
jgi:hypothetical protein